LVAGRLLRDARRAHGATFAMATEIETSRASNEWLMFTVSA
jgi:hypothetical protein